MTGIAKIYLAKERDEEAVIEELGILEEETVRSPRPSPDRRGQAETLLRTKKGWNWELMLSRFSKSMDGFDKGGSKARTSLRNLV